jgi:hypothetical protein
MSLVIVMALTEMTFGDRIRLSQLRSERLRGLFAQNLLHCVLRCDRHHTLLIHCPEAWMVDRLLPDAEELCDYAWLILGVEAIALYFAQEEICRVQHRQVHRTSSSIRHNSLRIRLKSS